MKQLFKFFTSRLFIFGLSIFAQVLVLVLMVLFLSNYGLYMYIVFTILSVITILYIISKDDNPIYKLAWTIPIAMFPILGWFFYYVAGRGNVSKKMKKRIQYVYESTKELSKQDESILEELKEYDGQIINHVNYINKTSSFPIYKNTQTQYLSPGEEFFDVLCAELKKAKKFIFMEYFIIQEGTMWDEILDIMAQKVKEGVEVKVMYDDLGCIRTVPTKYYKKLQALGIEVHVFNVFKPSIDVFMNYRDHRKITVIDGNVGFTGGNNLADEYINAFVKHGHWKDSSIMLKGDAVWNLSIMFLQMWQYYERHKIDFSYYRPTEHYESDGYVMPYGDGPLDQHLIGEMAYINIISRAKKYVSITTPYLILDNEMMTALCLAANSGVEVTIITPHVADKWYVHMVTRYNYIKLITAGVQVYEYTPGFVHAKTIVADDEIAIVGTQNFDFRSFYLHYECGAFLYKTSSIADVRKDHLNTLMQSEHITQEVCNETKFFTRFMQKLLNIFAPLM
ncbi:cardiolipin synthase [Paludicola sp. MB14-C6]|uniref:cardiolipin synthase n=1 Tax=Paludihabitans sp. MB14-C6 TaxID=3070656 RepID=UPI0027DBD16E|nr:cardiolipin synthase [Paludicola sp. MB14-C6]WMJ22583.1 cardiolipin synthase [Paludicola sp. MB14-C6]